MKQVFEPAAQVEVPSVIKKRSMLPWVLGAMALLVLGSAIVLGIFLLRPKKALLWHVTVEVDQATPDREAAVRQTIKVLEKRLVLTALATFKSCPGLTAGLF